MDICDGKKVVLWCDGLKMVTTTPKPTPSQKRNAHVESDDDLASSDDGASVDYTKSKKKENSAQETREERVEETVYYTHTHTHTYIYSRT